MPLKTSAHAGLAIPKADTAAIAAALSPRLTIMVTPVALASILSGVRDLRSTTTATPQFGHQLCACPSCVTVATQRTRRIAVRRRDPLGAVWVTGESRQVSPEYACEVRDAPDEAALYSGNPAAGQLFSPCRSEKCGQELLLSRDLWVMSCVPRVLASSRRRTSAGQAGSGVRPLRPVALIWGGFTEFCSQNLFPSDR